MPLDLDKVEPLDFTRSFAGGFRADLKRRGKWYVSDWTEAFKDGNSQITLASTLFLFFACIAPAIAFGALFDKGTDGQLGAFEMILSSAFSGIVYAFFAGQPLCIMGATGPELAYTLVFKTICDDMELEFMPARFWCGMWCALMTVTLALTDSNAIMCYVTQYTEDVFSALISLIFIIEAFINIFGSYYEVPIDAFFLTVLLGFGSFGLAMYFRAFRTTRWTKPFLRNLLANFGVTIAVLIFTFIAIGYSEVKVDTLNMPDSFAPTMVIQRTGKRRGWLINPFYQEEKQEDFPLWGIFFTFPAAIGLCILGFLDQNLTSLLINRKANNLKKPPAYHLDLLVCGVFIYPICSLFGLPFTHAATIRSLTHLISLTTYDEITLADGSKKKVPVKANEQRWTQLLIHTLIALSSLAADTLRKIPLAVLYGIFLYMGVSTINGNDLFDRMFLWLIWDPSKYPSYKYLQAEVFEGNKRNRVHLFTLIQFMLLVILYALKSIKQIAVVFPFFLIVIVLVRLGLKRFRIFSEDELKALDGTAADNAEGDASPPESGHEGEKASEKEQSVRQDDQTIVLEELGVHADFDVVKEVSLHFQTSQELGNGAYVCGPFDIII